MVWMKLARMRTMTWSLRGEPHQQKGKDRARSQMLGMTGMTAPFLAVVVATREPRFVPEQGEGCNIRQTKAQGGE